MAGAIAWQALAPFGVEIDCDLAAPLHSDQEQSLRGLLRDHGLILARRQSLSMPRQREICALFGPILLREGEGGTMSNEGGGYAASELAWHSDAAYTPWPFDALALHALDVVDGASSTLFIDAQAALAELPDGLRQGLSGREQAMIAPHYTRLAERTCNDPEPEAMKQGTMPTVFTNPMNGKACLWVNAMQTVRLLDMPWEQGRALLNAVFDLIYAPEKVLEHRWRKGDIVIWDNIALQHMRGNVEQVGKRVLQRVIVGTHGVAPHVG